MRKRKHPESEEDIDLNITPMLDIVFIILIFFVVSTSFVKESGVDVSRPSAQSSERKQRGNIMVAITADNAIKTVYCPNEQIYTELGGLQVLVKRYMNEEFE